MNTFQNIDIGPLSLLNLNSDKVYLTFFEISNQIRFVDPISRW